MSYSHPVMPQTPDLLGADDPDQTPPTAARPDLKDPPRNPPVDREALDRSLDVYSRVKPY